MKSACVGVLSIIESKNARWNIEISSTCFEQIIVHYQEVTMWLELIHIVSAARHPTDAR